MSKSKILTSTPSNHLEVIKNVLQMRLLFRWLKKRLNYVFFSFFFKADILSVPLLCLYDFQSLIEAEKQSSKSVWCLEMGSRLRSYTRRQLIRYTKNIWRKEVSKGAKQKSGNNGGVQRLKWTKICYFIFGAKIQKKYIFLWFSNKNHNSAKKSNRNLVLWRVDIM